MYIIDLSGLNALLDVLRAKGYSLVGPTVRSGAIVYDTIASVDDLPKGWTDIQEPASYRLERRGDSAVFGFVVGPQSWKRFLFPPRISLFSASRKGKGFDVDADEEDRPGRKYAFVGVRSCELYAIAIQDKVLLEGSYVDPSYASLRKDVFIVAVNCGIAGGNCFCASMNTGPRVRGGYDLVLTEIVTDGTSSFVVDQGSEAGKNVLQEVPHRPAGEGDKKKAEDAIEAAVTGMGKTMNTAGIKEVLYESFDHKAWDAVAARCLACANCTMVCPTCFCTTVEDITDLTGEHAGRWRRWDSCFTLDFAKVAGGNFRSSVKARYRQWMTHKLASWIDQFGTSGCVGCGRCITWCPVGIDITAEVQAIRSDSSTKGV